MIARRNDERTTRLLSANEESWCERMTEFLASSSGEVEVLAGARVLLATKRDADRGPAGHAWIGAMLARLDEELRQRSSHVSEEMLEAYAARIDSLGDESQRVDAELQTAKDTLSVLLGPRTRRDAGEWRILIGSPGWTLRVSDPRAVPPAFRSAQPDRRAILAHFRQTGEIVAGTQIGERRAPVTIRRTKDRAGSDRVAYG